METLFCALAGYLLVFGAIAAESTQRRGIVDAAHCRRGGTRVAPSLIFGEERSLSPDRADVLRKQTP